MSQHPVSQRPITQLIATSAQSLKIDKELAVSLPTDREVRLLGGYARYLALDPRLADAAVRETVRRARAAPRALSRRRLLATLRQVIRQAS